MLRKPLLRCPALSAAAGPPCQSPTAAPIPASLHPPQAALRRRCPTRSACLGFTHSHYEKQRHCKCSSAVFWQGAEGLASVSGEKRCWLELPLKGGPVSPLLAKNVPPARFPNARTLPGFKSFPRSNEKSQASQKRYLTFLCFLSKNDALGQKEGEKNQILCGFSLISVFESCDFPKKM